MSTKYLTIKKLTETVGGGTTPRMVRHYHQIGLLPEAIRSSSNYRLYNQSHVQYLRQIVALKQQGFQLEHIRQLLGNQVEPEANVTLLTRLQQHYYSIIQKISRLRQTASALERLLGGDRSCQTVRAKAIAQIKQLNADCFELEDELDPMDSLWEAFDASILSHPEAFEESLTYLLPDLSGRSEIEADLISKLVLACGDVSLVHCLKISQKAIAAAREGLKSGCQIVGDVGAISAVLDHPRLAHLGCRVDTLIDNPHIISAAEAEQEFWHSQPWQEKLLHLEPGCILVVGYAPSTLVSICQAISNKQLKPALVIGMPIGFNHAPAAKRLLINSGIPSITISGTFGGGLLAGTALNAIAQSTIEKPDCHCYLSQ
ncbi:MAG: MerR family transcriptional regulator [Sphaerospermopsis sp. SIO1G2]|nr:MerR family transcriptional regulator [Sphaerospermopsis sp. SIO1G1]NET72452.1 MerR family transcriptional regulator [Sphaerospermopsis sp. SIO1G2]